MTAASPWPSVRLDAVGNVVTGGTPPTGDRSNYGRQHLFVSPADLGRTKYVRSTAKMLSAKGFAKSRRIPTGSTLFVCIGSTIGKIGLAGEDLTTNQQINSIVPKGAVDPEFLFYAASTLSAFVREQAGEQAVPLVNKSQFSEFEIPLPPLNEQRVIAMALSDADRLADALECLIRKKQAIRQGMMQQLLTGRTRLPGFTDSWQRLAVASRSMMKARIGWQGLKTDEYRESGTYRLVGGTEFVDGRIDWNQAPFVDEWRYDQDAYIQLRVGDVLLTKDGTIGKIAYVDALPGPATLNSGVFVLRPIRNAYDPAFLYWMLRSRAFDEFLGRLTAGSTISHLYQRDLFTLVLDVPSTVDEQRAIAGVLDDTEEEISVLQQRLAKARAIKTGMMQQLLTGRVRLPLEAAS